ncbi:MAG: DUF5777 family beta-barrel protein [Chitinophagaceae bacterium]
MKRFFLLMSFFISVNMLAQDSTMNSLTKDMDKVSEEKIPVKIFNSTRTINANTTQVTGKGKMDFNVTHNFGDIAGDNGGSKTFFGLDAITDDRIGFTIGLGKKFDLITARAKGAGPVQNLWQLGFKYLLMQQMENDPTHPLSIALFADAVLSSQKRNQFNNQENSFSSFSDRWSNVVQLILAKKMGKVSLQLNPTLTTRSYTISWDQKNIFAMGGAIRFPMGRSLNLVLDYFHPFRNQSSKDSFSVNQGLKFYDPIGVGFEIITAGHIFHLNFTNATEILENRFIPRTTKNWGDGEFRWGFNISRTFVLWRKK